MSKQKKVNPNKQPITAADRNKAVDKAIRLTMAIFLFVMVDRFGFTKEQAKETFDAVLKLSTEVSERRISREDLLNVLEEEYDITELK